MNNIVIPSTYNYCGVFLTFGCNLKCSYCINKFNVEKANYKQLSTKDWIDGLNRIVSRPDLPITLQGGEPTIHPGFYSIVNNVDKKINIDVLTNAQFDVNEFTTQISPARLKRDAKYASIRVSYHPEQMDLDPLIEKVKLLKSKGYSVGVWIVDHPKDKGINQVVQKILIDQGIDCRLKEFLGWYDRKLYGTYKYPNAMKCYGSRKPCFCKPSELLIAPDGGIHRCHYYLYTGKKPYAHILDSHVNPMIDYTPCDYYGLCNPCDIKTKFDRFQVNGHCSVEIKEV